MFETIKKARSLLSESERRKSYLLLLMIIAMALMEVVGVSSLMPFMAVLANPNIITENRHFAEIYQFFSFSSVTELQHFLGVVVFVALISSISFKALTQYALLRFTNRCSYELSMRLLVSYLRQPYEWFLQSHSADLTKNILAEPRQVVNETIVPLMQIIANSAVAISLLIMLVIANPFLAFSVALGLGSAYTLIYLSYRGYLAFIGEDRQKANQERFKAIHEIFGGIKDVKVSGLEKIMKQRFEEPAERFMKRTAASQVAGQLPRYALEAIAFGGMLIVILYLMADEEGLKSALPMMTLYAFAAYRLMPALQQVYTMLSQLRFGTGALNTLKEIIDDLPSFVEGSQFGNNEHAKKLALCNSLNLVNVNYTYPKSESTALDSLSLTIPARTTVAFVGKTGSGKSTCVDVILGLLRPQTGSVSIDGVELTESNLRQWQNSVGYVPQHIYLSDDTLQANIAFGVPTDEVDLQAVEQASRIANLHDFVIQDMPDGYMTRVGERGVRLSGGQRQRIGIARALYHNPEILILDEATSALDNLTEQAVMEAVHNLGHKKTIILIAHRLSTVRDCDEIFLMDKGRLVANGTYDNLVEDNETFRSMVAQSA